MTTILYIIIYLITILSLILLFTLFILVAKPLIYGVNEYSKDCLFIVYGCQKSPLFEGF